MKKIKQNFVLVCLLFSCSLLLSYSAGWAPKILEALEHLTVTEGRPVIFKSKTSASPVAEFKCFFGNSIVTSSDRFSVSYGDGIALFIIEETQMGDNKDVKFEFTNILGESTTKAHLTVTKLQ